jgi:hypothetical protein
VSEMVCLTHYEMLENHIAKLEAEIKETRIQMNLNLDMAHDLSVLNEKIRRALTIIEDRHHPDSEWCDEAKEVLK